MSLTRQTTSTPTGSDTFETMTLGDSDNVNVFVLLENVGNVDLLFEVGVGPVDLISGATTVKLDFNQVSTLLVEGGLADLSVSEDTDDSSNTLQLFKRSGNGSTTFSFVLLSELGEGLALGAVPVLVETTFNVVTQVFSHDSGNGTKTTGSLNITSNTTDNHGGSFNHSDSFQNFLLVHLGSRTIEIADNVCHTSLEAHEGSQVDGLASIVAGEGLDLSVITSRTLTGQETKRTVTGSFEFTMRLKLK